MRPSDTTTVFELDDPLSRNLLEFAKFSSHAGSVVTENVTTSHFLAPEEVVGRLAANSRSSRDFKAALTA
jgi:hypothetical protein